MSTSPTRPSPAPVESKRAPGHGFKDELSQLINKWSMETRSGTPDFILAGFLRGVLHCYDTAVIQRRKWYEGEGQTVGSGENPSPVPDPVPNLAIPYRCQWCGTSMPFNTLCENCWEICLANDTAQLLREFPELAKVVKPVDVPAGSYYPSRNTHQVHIATCGICMVQLFENSVYHRHGLTYCRKCSTKEHASVKFGNLQIIGRIEGLRDRPVPLAFCRGCQAPLLENSIYWAGGYFWCRRHAEEFNRPPSPCD